MSSNNATKLLLEVFENYKDELGEEGAAELIFYSLGFFLEEKGVDWRPFFSEMKEFSYREKNNLKR